MEIGDNGYSYNELRCIMLQENGIIYNQIKDSVELAKIKYKKEVKIK